MRLILTTAVLWLTCHLILPQLAWADIAEVDRLQARLVNGKRPVDLGHRLKRDHGLSESEISKLRSQGLDDRQITIAARLAKASHRPLNEIVRMRLQEKKGWGEIADNLGVDPKDIGLKIMRKVHWQFRARSA